MSDWIIECLNFLHITETYLNFFTGQSLIPNLKGAIHCFPTENCGLHVARQGADLHPSDCAFAEKLLLCSDSCAFVSFPCSVCYKLGHKTPEWSALLHLNSLNELLDRRRLWITTAQFKVNYLPEIQLRYPKRQVHTLLKHIEIFQIAGLLFKAAGVSGCEVTVDPEQLTESMLTWSCVF